MPLNCMRSFVLPIRIDHARRPMNLSFISLLISFSTMILNGDARFASSVSVSCCFLNRIGIFNVPYSIPVFNQNPEQSIFDHVPGTGCL